MARVAGQSGSSASGLEECISHSSWDKPTPFGSDTNHKESRHQDRCCLLCSWYCSAGARSNLLGYTVGWTVAAANCSWCPGSANDSCPSPFGLQDDMTDSLRDYTNLPEAAPLLTILDMSARAKYVMDVEEITPEIVEAFVSDFLADKLKPEPI